MVKNMFSDSSSSDDSQVPDALLTSQSAFRVSVCLERYFTDARARCYILVPRNQRVRWLQRRLQKLFPLLGNFHLSTNGHMLPPSEPLALLTSEDTIDVIPYQEIRAERADFIPNKDDTSVRFVNNKRKGSAVDTPYNNKHSNPIIYNQSHQDSNTRFLNSEKNVISSNCSLQDDIDGVNTSPVLEETSSMYINGNDLNSIQKLEPSENTQTLSNLKQQALALLDSQVAVDSNTIESLDQDSLLPSRRRRRVRKRKGQMHAVSHPDFSVKDSTLTSIDTVPCSEDVTVTSSPGRISPPPVEQSSTERLPMSPQHEVARNNAICSRKPRLVQSLNC